MVRGHYDDRAVLPADSPALVENLGEARIGIPHPAVVETRDVLEGGAVQVQLVEVVLPALALDLEFRRVVQLPREPIAVRRGWVVRAVYVVRVHEQEEGTVSLAPQPLENLGCEIGQPAAEDRALPRRSALVIQIESRVEAEVPAQLPSVDEGGRLVARVPEDLRHVPEPGRVVHASVLARKPGRAVPVLVDVPASEDRPVRRRGRRRLGEHVAEDHRLPRQPIQDR